MANPEHLEILKQGVVVWNRWQEENSDVRPNLQGVSLPGVKLDKVNLSSTDLKGADFTDAHLKEAILDHAILDEAIFDRAILAGASFYEASLFMTSLREADLQRARFNFADMTETYLHCANLKGANFDYADLHEAEFYDANLEGASLVETNLNAAEFYGADLTAANLTLTQMHTAELANANLRWAILRNAWLSLADFRGADLREADLTEAVMVGTSLVETDMRGCRVYGISAWDLKLSGARQQGLIITPEDDVEITVDDLEVAQFIYLMLNNENIRNVINTITSKAVLILGRFTEERKAILDALRDELRKRDYLPILFDFEKPAGRDLTETISTLSHMSRFVIADVTDAKSIPQELQAIVPNLPSVPVRLIIQEGKYEYAMLEHFKRYPWVIETYQYKDTIQLLGSLTTQVIEPAEAKVEELKQG